MLNDHDKFIDEVIKKVTTQKNKGQTKSLREQKEKITVESLMEVTGLPEHEIIQIMEETRKEQKDEQRRQYSPTQSTASIDQSEETIDNVASSIFKWNIKSFLIVGLPIIVLYIVVMLITSNNNTGVENQNTNEQMPNSQISASELEANRKLEQQAKEQQAQIEQARIAKQKEIAKQIKNKNRELLNAIKNNETQIVSYLIEDGAQFYTDENKKDMQDHNKDPFFLSAFYATNNMTNLILSLGVDPFYNIKAYDRAIIRNNDRNNKTLNNIIFNHLATLDTTPTAIKKLWEKKIPYTRYGVQQAYNDKDFDALALFEQANVDNYNQTWVEKQLVSAIYKNDINDVHEFIRILIKSKTDQSSITRISSNAMISALQFEKYEIAQLFFELGVDPTITLDSSVSNMNNYRMFKDDDVFFHAALRGQSQYVQYFLEEGYDTTKQDMNRVLKFTLSEKYTRHFDMNSFQTIYLLHQHGVELNELHLTEFSSRIENYYIYNKLKDENSVKPYRETVKLIADNVKFLPLDEKILNNFILTGYKQGIDTLIKNGVSYTAEPIKRAINKGYLDVSDALLKNASTQQQNEMIDRIRERESYRMLSHIFDVKNSGHSQKEIKQIINYMTDKNMIDATNKNIKKILESNHFDI